jgi:hypothetical protein
MERFRTEEDDATEDLAGANTLWFAERPITPQIADSDDEVTCDALHLALSAIHLDIAWHTGVISVEAAMESLHREIVEAVSRYTRSNQTTASERTSRSPMPASAMKRKTLCGQKTELSLSRLLFGNE